MSGGEIVLFREDTLTQDFICHFLKTFGVHLSLFSIAEKKNQNFGETKKLVRLGLNSPACKDAKFVIICIDNDRSPGHPGGRNYGEKAPMADSKSHYETMLDLIKNAPTQVACKTILTVPVEMIESWILMIFDNKLRDVDVPPFGRATSKSARNFYHNDNPPPQCKDLLNVTASTSGQTSYPFGKNINQSDYVSLAARSRSFEMFFGKCRRIFESAKVSKT
jgi:hypothetical protein